MKTLYAPAVKLPIYEMLQNAVFKNESNKMKEERDCKREGGREEEKKHKAT